MKQSKKWYDMPLISSDERSWMLVVVASVIIVVSGAVAVLTVMNFAAWGWWFSLLLLLGSISSIGLSLQSIITGNPAWILIDLILPG